MIQRRKLLLALGSLMSGAPIIAYKTKGVSQSQNILYDSERRFPAADKAGLHHQARAKGLIYGAFPSVGGNILLREDLALQSTFIHECGCLTSGFYWDGIRPSINRFDFSETDAFIQFASSNRLLFRGHPLVWNQGLPQWLNHKFEDSTISPQEIERILINHVATVVGRYAGRVHSWDVVNEAVWPDDRQISGLRKTPWLEFLGSRYIGTAFQVARAADSNALLVYNGDRLDHNTLSDKRRRVATLRLLEDLVTRDIPIDALGIQAHLHAGTPFNSERLRSFLRDVASLGLKILITELDVIDTALPGNIVIRDRMIAALYEDYLNTVLDEPAVIAVLTWGLSDRYTWLSQVAPRHDGLPVRPLPLDENLDRKLAWNAMSRAFSHAPQRV